MAEGNRARAPRGGDGDIDPRGLGIVLVIAALMALAIGGGMLLTRHDDAPRADTAPVPVRTTAPHTTTFRPPTSVLPLPQPAARVPTPVAPSIDIVNRKIGDDCSANGVPAQWELTPYSGWVCTPRARAHPSGR